MEITSDFPDVHIPDDITIGQLLLDRCRLHGDVTALVEGSSGHRYTYNDVIQNVVRLNDVITRLGIKRGDVVLVCMGNCPEHVFLFLSLAARGIVGTAVSPAHTVYEITRLIIDSGATTLVVGADNTRKASLIWSDIPSLKHVVSLGPPEGRILSLPLLMKCATPQNLILSSPLKINARREVAILAYSSGTTGKPKGTMMSHFNLIAQTLQIQNPALRIAEPGDVLVVTAPLYHAAGKMFLTQSMYTGGTILIRDTYDYDQYLCDVVKYKRLAQDPRVVSSNVTSPTTHPGVISGPLYDLSKVTRIVVGSAPISKDILEAVCRKLGIKEIIQGYGMTESTACTHYTHSDDISLGSVGKLIPNTQAKVIDVATGQSLGPNQRGELCVKGPQVMLGYKDLPDQTAQTIDQDGLLHTGDIAYYDKSRHFYIVDRLKELIKVKAFQVSPVELEEVIQSMEGVSDAAVAGVPDVKSGQLPCAYVIRDNSDVTEERIHAYVKERLAPYKQLRGGIRFVTSIPRTPSGKIVRCQLQEMWSPTTSKL